MNCFLIILLRNYCWSSMWDVFIRFMLEIVPKGWALLVKLSLLINLFKNILLARILCLLLFNPPIKLRKFIILPKCLLMISKEYPIYRVMFLFAIGQCRLNMELLAFLDITNLYICLQESRRKGHYRQSNRKIKRKRRKRRKRKRIVWFKIW